MFERIFGAVGVGRKMKRPRVASSIIVFAVLCSSSLAPAAANATSSAHTMTIMDDVYDIPAGSVQVPAGWLSIGTVMRVPGCHGNPFLSTEFTLSDRDGLTAVAVLPGATWSYTDGALMQNIMARNRCPEVVVKDAASFLANVVVPSIHPGAQIIGVSSGGPLLRQALANEQTAAPRFRYTAAAVRVRYDRAGAMADEELNAIVGCSDLHSMAMFQSPAYTTTTCSTYSIAIARAPFGHLDDFLRGPTYGNVIKSVKTDTVWLHRMVADQNARFQAATQEFNRVAAQSLANLKAEGEAREARAKQFDANLAASTRASMAAAQASQDARTEFAHQVVNFASDKADYINSATGQQLNIDYNANHSWGSTDGTTAVLNNDPVYNPNGVVNPVGSSFVELVPKQ